MPAVTIAGHHRYDSVTGLGPFTLKCLGATLSISLNANISKEVDLDKIDDKINNLSHNHVNTKHERNQI